MKKEAVKYKFFCLRCRKLFEAKTEFPVECSNCNSHYWDTERKIALPNRKKRAVKGKTRSRA